MINEMSETPRILLVNRAVILEEDHILLLQRSPDNSHNPEEWESPGGQIDPGETIEEGTVREVDEETGLKIELSLPLAYVERRIIEDGKYEGRLYVVFFHLARILSGDLKVSDEHTGAVWQPSRSLMKVNLTPQTNRALSSLRHQGII